MQTKLPLLLTYPSSTGDYGRYTNEDQREYFKKYPGGVTDIVRMAVYHRLQGDILSFYDEASLVFNSAITPIGELITQEHYAQEQREFRRRCFDIWRFITTVMVNVDTNHYKVRGETKGINSGRISFLIA